jgi:succinyl-CoA synthetase alpha subunit
MAILLDQNSRIVIQGITGSEGGFHTRESVKMGSKVVAGVTPGKGGMDFDGIPVYERVCDAMEKRGATISGIYARPEHAPNAIFEAIEAGISVIVCMTEGIPVLEMVRVKQALKGSASRMIGPNCPGITTPGVGKVGFMPNFIHRQGNVGIVTRSGTLAYEMIWQLSQLGIGQSTSVGIGGDPIVGTGFIDILELFEKDPQTEAIVMIGEIGGTAEEEAAEFIQDQVTKPIVSFIAGRTAPPGRRMGHAGAIISGGRGTAEEKFKALKRAGVIVEKNPAEIGRRVQEILQAQ